jgi:hypothetical protein
MQRHPKDFEDTHPIAQADDSAGDAEDPHLAGLAAQADYFKRCRVAGQPPLASEAGEAYWSAYRTTSQWGGL